MDRLQLQTALEALLGSRNVYFQPPPNLKMKYPCITYQRDVGETRFADNLPYRYSEHYSLTVIDPNPDSDIPAKVRQLPMCRHAQFFIADNLNHDVFDIFI